DAAGAVKARWEDIKREDEGREGIFHHVPETLPALLLARKAQGRARAVGFEYADAAAALADLGAELTELRAGLGVEPAPETEADPRHLEELGYVLFAAGRGPARVGRPRPGGRPLRRLHGRARGARAARRRRGVGRQRRRPRGRERAR